MRKINLLLGAFIIFVSSCQKEQAINIVRTYSGIEICQKIDSLESLYGCQMNFEFDTAACVLSDDAFNQIEQILAKESTRRGKHETKSAEYDAGDNSELLIHCITAYSGDGGDDVIGTGRNDITSYSIMGCDGYHKNGTPVTATYHKEGCVYFQVKFTAFYYPYALVNFNGIFEYDNATDFIEWVEDDMMYVSGTWDWNPGKLKYYYNEVALASEYDGTKKSQAVDKVTGGLVSYYTRQRFVFIIYNVRAGEVLDYYNSGDFTMRGYFANE